jgi:6-phosphogluconolactonase (cycloisomerase 2 family)
MMTPLRYSISSTHRALGAVLAAALAAAVLVSAAAGSSMQPTVFVANNGNLEGSVSSFIVNPDGTTQFVMKYVTGSRPNTQEYHPGTNAYAISLTPSGDHVATSHATSSETVEQITVLAVAADATLSLVGTFATPDSPLDLQWIRDDVLAVTRTSLSVTNQVIVYRFDPGVPSLVEIDRENTGLFSTALVLHPSGDYLYAQDSTGNMVTAFSIGADDELALIGTYATGGTYPLGPGVTHDGTKLYAGGGISSGGNKVVGFTINPSDGTLALMSGSPFTSPGSSPKVAVASRDDQYLFVGHGTDATVRVMSISAASGALSYTGFMFDVGLQGSLGDIAVLDNFMFVTDNTTATDGIQGLYSFTVNANGSLTPNGAIASTTGATPTALAVWEPPPICPGDANGDFAVDNIDLQALLDAWATSSGDPDFNPAADFDEDGEIGNVDLQILLDHWGNLCT